MPVGRPERALLLRSLFFEDLDAPAIRAAAAAVRDWPRLAAEAHAFALDALLWNALASAGAEALPPAPVADRLRESAAELAAQNACRLRSTLRAAEILRAEGIVGLPVKGMALLAVAPACRPLRFLHDTDLLVRREDLVRADAALLAAGAERTSDPTAFFDPDALRSARALDSNHNLATFLLDGDLIELHHDLPGRPGQGYEGLDGVWERRIRVEVLGRTLEVPSLEDQASILSRHVLGGHAEDAFYVPRHVADLHALARAGADLPAAARRTDRPGDAPVAATLALAAAARRAADRPGRLGLGPAERLHSPLGARLERLSQRLRSWHHYRKALAGNLRHFGWRAIFPPRRFLAARFGVREDAWWLPALHLARWAIGAWHLVVPQR